MKNLIIVDHEPFTIRRRELFYIRELMDRSVSVQVWGISQYCYPSIKIVDTIDGERYVIRVFSLEQLAGLLKKTDIANTLFILEFFRQWKNRKLLRLFSDFDCLTMRIDLYANTVLKASFLQKIERAFSKSLLLGVNNRIHTYAFNMYRRMYHLKYDKLYLSSSSIVLRTTKINHPDYEKYKYHEHPRLIEGLYIVFCDIYFPFHPDYKYFYGLQLSDGQEYHKAMCCFFDFIEKKYKMPIIIAAHPKADYKGDEFGNRKIIKYQTDNLVYHSQAVMMHNCNSISYTVLADKPIAFISTNEYESLPVPSFHSLKLLAATLNKEVYNIERDDLNRVELTKIDVDSRYKYIYGYLTSQETANKKNVDIIVELLK